MKKTLTRIWGIGLVVVLLASLLVVAVPASAATNAWGNENSSEVNIIAANTLMDVANYGNGAILYGAAGTTALYKSTNGGVTW